MSDAIKKTVGISGAALLIVIATNAKPLFEGLQAGWIFFSGITSKASLGVGAFLLSLTLAALLMWFLDKWIPRTKTPHGGLGRSFLIELVALGTGVYVTYLQIPSPMMGLLVGTVAGLLAPLVYRGCAGLIAWGSSLFKEKAGDPAECD